MTFLGTGGEMCFGQVDMEFVWEIKDFPSFSTTVSSYLHSPTFRFCDRSWFLRLYPNGESFHNSEGFLSLYLECSRSADPLEVRISLGIRTLDGKTREWINFTRAFIENDSVGTKNGIPRSDLLRQRDDLMPLNVLTLTARIEVVKAGTQNVSRRFVADVSVQRDCSLGDSDDETLEKTGVEKVLQDIGKLWETGENSDVVVKVKDVQFKAHKTILSARIPVLSAMFQHDTVEKASGEVTIDDCEPNVFEQLLHFIYKGAPRVLDVENASELYVVADKYLVKEVKDLCLRCMQDTLCLDNFCHTVLLSFTYGEQELLETAIDFFSRNMALILKTVEWHLFSREHLTWANEIMIRSMDLIDIVPKKRKNSFDTPHAKSKLRAGAGH